jgi:hypothetical protein
MEALDGVASAAVFLHGHGRGLDCLLPLKDRNVMATVTHSNPEELEVLRAMYPQQWRYAAAAAWMEAPTDPQLVVAECTIVETLGPFLQARPRVLIAAGGAWETEAFTRDLAAITGAEYRRRTRCFRHGYPDEQFWFWFEPG